MSLGPGTRIGAYEIVTPLGAGGMGQVYRARDTGLDRDVALKLLPDSFANDADRLMRFEREAKTLATLNHPHIAQIYGIEHSGTTRALVMELVEGEDLSTRIARGPIPLDDALPIARQIAAALQAAHDRGIIHRDLKPANIRLSDDGTVKVLDFGLAKAIESADGTGRSDGSGREDILNSPTVTSPAMTAMGLILGTAAYMAPEQAKGKTVDKRADIWAFGCVLYEMLVGARPFDGDNLTEVLAAVVKDAPEIDRAPPLVHRLLRKCLEKDPRKRLRDIGDAWELLPDHTIVAPAQASRQWRLIAAVASAAAILGVLATWTTTPRAPDVPGGGAKSDLPWPHLPLLIRSLTLR